VPRQGLCKLCLEPLCARIIAWFRAARISDCAVSSTWNRNSRHVLHVGTHRVESDVVITGNETALDIRRERTRFKRSSRGYQAIGSGQNRSPDFLLQIYDTADERWVSDERPCGRRRFGDRLPLSPLLGQWRREASMQRKRLRYGQRNDRFVAGSRRRGALNSAAPNLSAGSGHLLSCPRSCRAHGFSNVTRVAPSFLAIPVRLNVPGRTPWQRNSRAIFPAWRRDCPMPHNSPATEMKQTRWIVVRRIVRS
jgi:hypothetical protein